MERRGDQERGRGEQPQHFNYHLRVNAPQLLHNNPENIVQISPRPSQISILPVESARKSALGHTTRRVNSELKFIQLRQDRFSPLAKSPTQKIKNLVFRPQLEKLISEQKTRLAALEQTMMFQRQRRLNKQACIKKMQRMSTPNIIQQRASKKFMRSQDNRQEGVRKFRRGKATQQSSEQQAVQARLDKKLREERYFHGLSKIPQHQDEHHTETVPQSSVSSELPLIYSRALHSSLLDSPHYNPPGQMTQK